MNRTNGPTLGNLAERVLTDEKLLKKHPDMEEMLKPRIQKNKQLIVECVIRNMDDPYLEGIHV